MKKSNVFLFHFVALTILVIPNLSAMESDVAQEEIAPKDRCPLAPGGKHVWLHQESKSYSPAEAYVSGSGIITKVWQECRYCRTKDRDTSDGCSIF